MSHEAEFKYRGQINKDLAECYQRFWDSELEKTVKNHAASAKRTASSLSSTLNSFSTVMKPEQTFALQAALSSMKSLALDLEQLKPWAKALTVFKLQERKRQEDIELDRLAAVRWGIPGEISDAEILAELRDFSDFVQNADGAAKEWLCSVRFAPNASFPTVYGYELTRDLNAASSMSGPSLRRLVISILLGAFADHWSATLKRGRMDVDWNKSPVWIAGIDDFDSWRIARRNANSLTTSTLTQAGVAGRV